MDRSGCGVFKFSLEEVLKVIYCGMNVAHK